MVRKYYIQGKGDGRYRVGRIGICVEVGHGLGRSRVCAGIGGVGVG